MSEGASLADKAKAIYERLDIDAKAAGYNLNPDMAMVLMLCEGLVTNIERYGYMACPCRLASGNREDDLDIICPCDYRDADLSDYGACYCALYVGDEILSGRKKAGSIPERRPPEEERKKRKAAATTKAASNIWRCKVCGYLCAMANPPGKCPICKADRDKFEGFTFSPATLVWRCNVCGYLCAMENPPLKCPVCKADRERFEKYG